MSFAEQSISPGVQISTGSPALRIFSKVLVLAILFLIFAGALVTSNYAGLSVPDWPTTYGENMFLYHPSKWQGGIFYEHGHRLIASTVGMLSVILCVWIWLADSRAWLKKLALAAVLLVIAQGVLGGLTVLYRLPTAVSMSHAIMAQTFLALNVIIAFALSTETPAAVASDKKYFSTAVTVLVLLYLQLILGALMRHTYSALALPDFPTMAGQWWPAFNADSNALVNNVLIESGQAPVTLTQMWIHLAHRCGALIVAAYLVYAGYCLMKRALDFRLQQIGFWLIGLVVLQFLLGVATVLSFRSPLVASLHVVTGALLMALTILFCCKTYSRR